MTGRLDWSGRGLVAVLAAAAVVASAVVGLIAIRTSPAEAQALGPGKVTVELVIEHSRFTPDRISVRPGTEVTFVVDNRDPIGHELIIGGQAVHAAHRTGSEPAHAPVPGEVSVGGGEVELTVFGFDSVGPVLFACHLPGHEAYGMTGVVEVRTTGSGGTTRSAQHAQ